MFEIKHQISVLEQRKVKLEYELEYTEDTLNGLDDDEKSSFNGEVEKIKEKIKSLEFEIQEANEAVQKLKQLRREIDFLEGEEEKIAPYKTAHHPKVVELREKQNKLEDEYAELYNNTLYRIQDL